jgi:Holliday junction resolvase RusA-like endonuclease
MQTIKFTIPGEPVAKPRQTRSDKWKKRPCVMKYRAWADHARLCAGSLPSTCSIEEMRCVANFSPPESWSKKKRLACIGQRHRTTPDADNVGKAVLDSLFDQDSPVADLVVRKRYDWTPRVDIEIDYEPGA